MRRSFSFAALTVSAALAAGLNTAPAAAQSDILLQARSGTPAGDRFRVDSAGGVVALSSIGIGVIPAFGSGDRMMWHPFKGAFRAGGTAGGTGSEWDDVNVGFYSWAGGAQTIASGTYSFAMGTVATASGQSSVALGEDVTADANHSIVLGRRATADANTGTFTWADASTSTVFSNNAANSFQIRAAGGVVLYTNSGASVGVSLNAGGSSWNVLSDRNRKRDFTAVDGEDVLARIRSLPVTTWAYIDEAESVRHMGPMAQDWHAAFGFGGDGTTINMSDLDGVNLAAVQALERRTAALQAQLAERDARIQGLEERLARMEALLEARHTGQP
jgi:hypothetical protein